MKDFNELKSKMFDRARLKPVDERFRTRSKGVDPPAIIRFEVDDKIHTFDFTQADPSDSDAEPNLTVRCTWETLREVWTGQLAGLEAIRLGAVEVEGSLRLGHALQSYFQVEKP